MSVNGFHPSFDQQKELDGYRNDIVQAIAYDEERKMQIKVFKEGLIVRYPDISLFLEYFTRHMTNKHIGAAAASSELVEESKDFLPAQRLGKIIQALGAITPIDVSSAFLKGLGKIISHLGNQQLLLACRKISSYGASLEKRELHAQEIGIAFLKLFFQGQSWFIIERLQSEKDVEIFAAQCVHACFVVMGFSKEENLLTPETIALEAIKLMLSSKKYAEENIQTCLIEKEDKDRGRISSQGMLYGFINEETGQLKEIAPLASNTDFLSEIFDQNLSEEDKQQIAKNREETAQILDAKKNCCNIL